jgi:hypothetical protein
MADEEQRGMIMKIKHKGRPYYHYAVLDGLGNCVHVHKKKNMITLDPLSKVLHNASNIEYIIEDSDIRSSNWSRASIQIGDTYTYSILGSNCESWVNDVRFGTSSSKQIDAIAKYITIASLLLF